LKRPHFEASFLYKNKKEIDVFIEKTFMIKNGGGGIKMKDLKGTGKFLKFVMLASFLICEETSFSYITSKLTDLADDYYYDLKPVNGVKPTIDSSTYPTFSQEFRVWQKDSSGAEHFVSSVNKNYPSKFLPNQSGVNYNHGLWVTATVPDTNYGENLADLVHISDNESYGLAIMSVTGPIVYTNSGSIRAEGDKSVGVMINSVDAAKTFINNGYVYGNDYSLTMYGTSVLNRNNIFVTNNGTLEGAVGIFTDNTGQAFLYNYGTINGDVRITPGQHVSAKGYLYNYAGGVINGNVRISGNLVQDAPSSVDVPGQGSSTLNNDGGTINGDIWLYGGEKGYMTSEEIKLQNAEGGVINGNVIAITKDPSVQESVEPTTVHNIDSTINGTLYAVGRYVQIWNFSTGISSTDATIGGRYVDGRADYGMVGMYQAQVDNYAYVDNEGDYGMVAFDEGTLANNYGTIKNGLADQGGNYGMAALDGGDVENYGTIQNTADYGMVACDAVGDINISIATNTKNNYYTGIVKNAGNYGMAALENGIVINESLIQNGKDTGMIASESESYAFNSGTVSNLGNDGMVARDGGRIYNDGIISNLGDVGMYVGGDSEGFNRGTIQNEGNIGAYVNGYFVNLGGTIDPKNSKGDEYTYAVVGGAKNGLVAFISTDASTVYNPIPNPDAIIVNTDGLNILQLGAIKEGAHSELTSSSAFFNCLVGSSYLRESAKNTKDNLGMNIPSPPISSSWTINGTHVFLGAESLWDLNPTLATMLKGDKTFLDTDITMGSGSNVTFIMGRNANNQLTTPVIVANSYNMKDGVHTNMVLDAAFITSENKISFRMAKVNQAFGDWSVPSTVTKDADTATTQIYSLEEALVNGMTTQTASSGANWVAHHEVDSDGNVYLVYERLPEQKTDDTTPVSPTPSTDSDTSSGGDTPSDNVTPAPEPTNPSSGDTTSGSTTGTTSTTYTYTPVNPAPGGYGEANSYPHSNLDVVNTLNILNKGYLYARDAALGTKNLQYGEIFGEWGDYSGTGAKYRYESEGVTGANFYKFDNYPELTAGISYGYAHAKVNYRKYKGSVEKLDTLGINGFLTWNRGNWLVTGAMGYSWTRHNLRRNFTDYDTQYLLGLKDLGPLVRHATKNFNSNEWVVGLETGYLYKKNSWIFYPYLGADYTIRIRDGYRESADSWAGKPAITGDMVIEKYTLKVDRDRYQTWIVKVGAMFEKQYGRWGFLIDGGWKYHFSDYNYVKGKFIDALDRGETVKFKSSKLDIEKAVGYATAGVTYRINDKFTVGMEYSGYYRSQEISNRFGATFIYKF
jgi:hypothetical protein